MDNKSKHPDEITAEHLEIIRQRKQKFLENNDQTLLDDPEIKPEVAESWIRSKEMKVNPYKPEPHSWSVNEAKRLTEHYVPLMESVASLIDTLKDMISTEYLLELIGKNGITIMREGNFICPPFADEEKTVIYTESTMGTGAHTLSIQLKRPIQLIGPEHYCIDLENVIASATPVMDDNGEVLACLLLTQPMPQNAWGTDFTKQLNQTMALLISIAAAIEARGKLISSKDRLEFMSESLIISNNALEATLASVDEAIVTINRDGQIMNVNPEASRILRIKPEDVGSKNIREFLSEQSDLLELSANQQSVSTDETILVLGQERKYTINIRPILNHSTGKLDMAVLKLTPAEKNIEKSTRVGNTTRFRFEDIIGDSKPMKQAMELGKRFAGTMEAILLSGESGTGKELFAQAIHNYIHPNGPFMAVNCAAMPKNLIESELFGYEGGSFTGADRTGRPGKIELASGGTLFLDEIGDMHLELQSVLLRVLEDKQVTRIGGKQSKKVDFRVVAATNRNLYEMVKDKTFREDLYFRLSVLPINLPPLRARGNDTLILSRHFIAEYCNKIGFKVPELSPEAQKLILKYNWPGNVRQLQNAIYYAVNTSQGNVIESENLPEFILYESRLEPVATAPAVDMGNEPLSIKKLEKAAIDLALLQSHNSIPRAAEMLGMSKATLYRKLKEFSANE